MGFWGFGVTSPREKAIIFHRKNSVQLKNLTFTTVKPPRPLIESHDADLSERARRSSKAKKNHQQQLSSLFGRFRPPRTHLAAAAAASLLAATSKGNSLAAPALYQYSSPAHFRPLPPSWPPKSQDNWVEILVVVDGSMVRYHGESTRQYILTLMNIVS